MKINSIPRANHERRSLWEYGIILRVVNEKIFFQVEGFCHISFGSLSLLVGRWVDLLLRLSLPPKIHEASGHTYLHCEEGNFRTA